MKRNYIYHFVALLLGGILLGACDQQSPREEALNKGDTTTSMRFEVRVAAEGTPRAIAQEDEPGTDGEQSVSSMTVLFNNLPPRTFTRLTAENSIVSTPVFEVDGREAAKVRRFSTLLNASGLSLTQSDFNKQKVVSLSDFDQLVNTTATDGKFKDFLMTATAEDADNYKITIAPDVKENEVGQTPEKKNLFQLSVERVLSKVQVHKAATVELKGEVAAEKGTLKVDELKYALAGSAKKAYLFRDFASESSKMIDDTTNPNHAMYQGETLIHREEVPADWKGTSPHPFLQRVSDQMQGGAKINFAAKNVEVATSSGSTTNGIYFLENSTSKKITGRGQLEYNRIAYVKVYGTFIPAKALDYNRTARKFEEVTDLSARRYKFTVTREVYNQLVSELGGEEDLKDPADIWATWATGETYPTLNVKDPEGTFYLGLKDHKIYKTLLAALKSGNGYNIRRYVGGKMVWLNPVNAQLVSEPNNTFVKNANTRRNNIYNLTIKGISGFGLPFDPVDPEDPNIPQPENPYQPIPDSHIKVDPLNSRILIQTSVLKWNYQELNYTF